MLLSEALKKHMREQFGVAATATDEDYRKAVSKAIEEGKLAPTKLAELQAVKDDAQVRVKELIAGEMKQFLTSSDFGTALATALKGIVQPAAGSGAGNNGTQDKKTETPATPPDPNAGKDIATIAREAALAVMKEQGTLQTEASPHYLLTRHAKAQGGLDAHTVSLKKTADRFDNTKSTAVYPERCPAEDLRGTPVMHLGRSLSRPSQQDKAVIGAVTKWHYGLALRNPGFKMSDTDNDLVEYAVRELPWTGFVGGDGDGHREIEIPGRKLTDLEVKALLNDAVSGGVNAVPVVYDDAAIITPLLTGELYPLVNVIPLARGRVVKAYSIGTPTLSSGIPEGTAIPLFDTTGFIAGLDTTIYPVVGAIEIGLDFEEDSPANFGQIVVDRYSERHLQWLDEQIALGDGTTEPLGIFNTAALTLVPSVNGVNGPLTLADLEALIFGVDRLYRRARGGRMVYVMNDVTYRRFRSIATATGWNTRLFGTNYEDYSLLGYPVRIVPNLPNNKIGFINLAFYRLYRRQGLQVRVTTDGKELTLKNLRLITVRALWGGRIFEAGAGALTVDAWA